MEIKLDCRNEEPEAILGAFKEFFVIRGIRPDFDRVSSIISSCLTTSSMLMFFAWAWMSAVDGNVVNFIEEEEANPY